MIIKLKYSNCLLVFDDGGFVYSKPNNTGYKIEFIVYKRILELAKRNRITIPIAFTASFLDIDRIYPHSHINSDADKIIRFLDDNKEFIAVWNHGLTHIAQQEPTEFFHYYKGKVSSDIQKEHFEISQAIFSKLGFTVNTFVPPVHAWEKNVTDILASQYGIKNIAIREFEKRPVIKYIKKPFSPYLMQFEPSNILNNYFRLGLGISSIQVNFNKYHYWKSRYYVKNSFPSTIFINRTLRLRYPIDHFFAHVQNLMYSDALPFFDTVINKIKKHLIK